HERCFSTNALLSIAPLLTIVLIDRIAYRECQVLIVRLLIQNENARVWVIRVAVRIHLEPVPVLHGIGTVPIWLLPVESGICTRWLNPKIVPGKGLCLEFIRLVRRLHPNFDVAAFEPRRKLL